MGKINLCEGIVAQMMETEAWSNVSGNYSFNESQIEKYADRIDWEELSGNSNITWTVSMLEKFKNKIDWKKMSSCLPEECMTVELIGKFRENWDWNELSGNSNLTMEVIDKYADYIDWKAFLNNWWGDTQWITEEFVKKYSDRMPEKDFKNSHLWRCMLERKEEAIKRMLLLV